MKQDLHKKVNDALQSLDGLQRAEANPFLYSKIRNRMEVVKEFVPKSLGWRMVTALVVIAVLNVVTIARFNKEDKPSNGAESVASEYAISLPQTY